MTRRPPNGAQPPAPYRSRDLFAAEISACRAFQRCTVDELVDRLGGGWQPGHIVSIEAGEIYPPPRVRGFLLKALGSGWAGCGRRRRWS
jgi:hypothetical protein